MTVRDHIVKIRMNADEVALLDDLRAVTGLSRADQLRRATLGEDRARSIAYGRELAAILAELGKIGSNVNQLAHVAHLTGSTAHAGRLDELADMIDRMRRTIRR